MSDRVKLMLRHYEETKGWVRFIKSMPLDGDTALRLHYAEMCNKHAMEMLLSEGIGVLGEGGAVPVVRDVTQSVRYWDGGTLREFELLWVEAEMAELKEINEQRIEG